LKPAGSLLHQAIFLVGGPGKYPWHGISDKFSRWSSHPLTKQWIFPDVTWYVILKPAGSLLHKAIFLVGGPGKYPWHGISDKLSRWSSHPLTKQWIFPDVTRSNWRIDVTSFHSPYLRC
jgi:hypothetical protein